MNGKPACVSVSVIVNGNPGQNLPLNVIEEDGKLFIELPYSDQDGNRLKELLDESKLVRPPDGVVPWNYKGLQLHIETRPKR